MEWLGRIDLRNIAAGRVAMPSGMRPMKLQSRYNDEQPIGVPPTEPRSKFLDTRIECGKQFGIPFASKASIRQW
jgi:hypothetical protein